MADATCSVDGCGRPVSVQVRRLCQMHDRRRRIYGDPLGIEPRRLSVSNVDAHGYRRIKVPGHPLASDRGWALEHRVIAWDHFGPFDPTYHVHHRNHDKLDNRPENLEILSPTEHAQEHAPRSVPVDVWVEARRSGMSYPAVGRLTGHNNGTVYKALARWRSEHPGEDLR